VVDSVVKEEAAFWKKAAQKLLLLRAWALFVRRPRPHGQLFSSEKELLDSTKKAAILRWPPRSDRRF
jgi:hypothetical protein